MSKNKKFYKVGKFAAIIAIAAVLLGATDRVSAYTLTVPAGGDVEVTTPITLTAGDNVITVGANGTGLLSGIISGTGNLVKQGDGLLALFAANTYIGSTSLQGGTIRLDNDMALSSWLNATSTQGLVTITGSGTIATTANRTISNRFAVADDASSILFDVASGTTLTMQNVTTAMSSTIYGGAIFTTVFSDVPTFTGGGNVVVKGNSTSNGGGLASYSQNVDVGFDLTELASLVISNNTAGSGNGGGIYVYSSGAGRSSTVAFGDDVTLSGNVATSSGTISDGGAIYIFSGNDHTLLDFGNHTTISGNSAKRFGGAIYAYASTAGFDASVNLGMHTLFDGNKAMGATTLPMGGGAIFSSHNLSVQGNTLFRNNVSGAPGGAVVMYGVSTGTLLLDTTTGDIGFTGNKNGVTFDPSGNATGGTANAIHLLRNTKLQVTGGNNVFFEDPISSGNFTGNSLATDGFSGIVQFKGTSAFLNNFTANVSEGTMRLGGGTDVTSAQLNAASGTFTVGASGTLAGSGTIGFAANMISGTLAPDSAVFAMSTWSDTTNSFTAGTGTTTIAAGSETVGTLRFTGATKFDGATILVDLDNGTNDQIIVNNAVTFGATNNNVISIKDAAIGGTYNIITSTTAAVGGDPSQYFSVSGNIVGLSGFRRYGVKVQYGTVGGIANNVVQVAISDEPGNTTLYWTGADSNPARSDQWISDTTTGPQNWTDVPGGTPSETRFLNGDRVIFDTTHTVGPFDVNISTPITVADMTVTGGGDYTIRGDITSQTTGTTVNAPTGKLVKTDTGTLTLDGTNNFAGGVDITGGTVKAETAASVAGGGVTMANDSTLQFDTTGSEAFASSIAGDGNLVKSDSGTLTLTGSNSYTGATHVTQGTLVGNIASGTDLTVNSGAIYQAGTASRTVSSLNGAGDAEMNNQSLTVGSGDFSDGTITNVGTLTKTGDETLTVGETNGVNLDHQSGTLIIAEEKSIILTGTANIADGTMLGIGIGDGVNPSITAAGAVTIGDNTTINITGYPGGSAPMVLIHSDTTITGGTDGGTVYMVGGVVLGEDVTLLQFVNDIFVDTVTNSISGQDLVITSGGLVWNNDGEPHDAHGNFHVEAGATATIYELLKDNLNTAATVNGQFGWDGKTLTKTGAGTMTVSHANTYTGNTIITGGTLIATNVQALGGNGTLAGSPQANIAGGATLVLNYTAPNAFLYEITGAGNLVTQKDVLINRDNSGFTGTTTISDGTLTLENQNAVGTSSIANSSALVLDFTGTFTNTITGIGSLTIDNSAGTPSNAVTLTGTSTFSGPTTINTGATLNMNNASALGSSAVTNSGTLALDDFAGATFTNSLSGAGQLNINDDVTIARANTGFTGNTTIAAGTTTTLQNANALGSTTGQTVTNNGTLDFVLANGGTFTPNIAGTGSLVADIAGTLTLTGTNTYTGGTTVKSGTLVADLADNTITGFPCGTALTLADGATFQAQSREQWISSLTGGANSTVQMMAADGSGNKNLTVCSGDISGGTIANVDTLTKRNVDGTLTVGTVTGNDLVLDEGTLNIASGKGASFTDTVMIQNGTTLGLVANPTQIALSAGNAVTIGNTATLSVTGYNPSMGTVVLIAADPSQMIANEFGTYMVDGVDQQTTISLANYINTSPIVQRGGANLSQIIISVGGLVWNNTAPGTAHGTFDVTGNVTVDGDLTDNTAAPDAGFNGWDGKTLTKTGDGTLTLTGDNDYSGGTQINEGKIVGTNAGAIGTGPISLNDTDTSVEYNIGGGTETAVNDITGTGSFVKSGDGTLIHTGDSTYTGTTTVSGGTLVGDLVSADPVSLPCGAPLVVGTGATYQTYSSDQSISSLTGAGTVNMNAYDGSGNKNLTVCSGDFSDGTLLNVDTLTKKNADTSFIIGTATVGNLNLAEGRLEIDQRQQLTVTGATTIAANTTLSLANNPALLTNTMLIGNNAILDVCGCSIDGWVVRSDNPLTGQFSAVYVGGNEVTGDVDITQFINSITVEYVNGGTNNPEASGIRISNGGLVWNNNRNTMPNEAHGTFDIATSFTVIQTLADRTAGDFVPVEGWDGKTLTKNGVGTLTLDAANTYSGGTNITSGKVVAMNAEALGTGTVTNDSQLEFNLPGDGTAANDITGTGSFTKNGTGTLILTGTNTYTGGTTVNRGTLVSNLADNTIPGFPCGTDLTVAAGATYSPYNADQFVAGLNGAGTVDMKSYNLTVCHGDFSEGLITGVDTLTKTSPSAANPTDLIVGDVSAGNLDIQIGQLTIAGGKAVTLTGNAKIGDSTALIMTAGSAPALAADGSLTLGDGTRLDVSGYDPSMGTIILINTGADIAKDFDEYTLNGVAQSSVVTLSDYRNKSPLIQRDATDLSQIIISIGGLVWNNTAPGTAHGTFDVATDDSITENLQDNPVSTAWNNGWDGKTLTKTGDGNLTLTGNNTYTGGTKINAGTLTAQNEHALGTGVVDINSDGNLVLDYNGTLTNTIRGTGDLEIDGNVNIAKSNPDFSGNTSLASGTTTLQQPDGLGSSAIALGDGTTLVFHTSSSGTSNNTISGTGNLVKDGQGTLTLENDNLYTGTTTIRGGTLIANLLPSDELLHPCGAALTVNAEAVYQARNREQFISILSGSGTVNMQGIDGNNHNLTICSGDFTGGTFENLQNVTKKSTGTLRVDGFEAENFTLKEGNFILNPGEAITLNGTADIQAGTTLDIGANLALDVAGAVTIDNTATLNITGYGGTGRIVLVHSDTGITGKFGTYTINGTPYDQQTPSLDRYYIVDGIEATLDEIIITESHLAWYDRSNDAAHGTFMIDSGTVTVADALNDNKDSDALGFGWDGRTLTKTGDGTLVLGNANTYTGDTVIDAGSVVVTGSNSLGDPTSNGIVRLTSNSSSLVFDYDTDGTFDKTVVGGGSLTKTDGNDLTITGNLSGATGTFTQQAGTVNLQTNFGGSYNQLGGRLNSTDGVTIAGSAIFAGTVAPTGTLTVDGPVYFSDDSAFYVELDGGVSKTLLVAEDVSIEENTTLQVNILSPLTVQKYKIIETEDGINGLFAGLERFNTFKYQLTQELQDQDTSLWLVWTPTENSFTDPFGDIDNPNAANAAGGADQIDDDGRLGELGDLGEALNNLGTDDDVVDAFQQLHGELFASGREGAAMMQRRFASQLPSARDQKAKTPCDPGEVACSNNSWNRWGIFTGDWTERASIGPYSGYDLQSSGIAFGFDRNINRRLFLGIALAYDNANQNFDSIRSRTEFNVFRSMLYAGYRKGSWYADAHFGYTKDWHKTRRDIHIGDFAGTARSKFDDDMLSSGLEIGRNLRVGLTDVTPSVGFKYIYIDSPAVTEHDADGANLHVYGSDYNSLRLSLGARFSRDFTFSARRGRYSRMIWTPELRAFYIAELCDDSATVLTSYNNVRDVRFSASSGSWGRHGGLFGAGLKAQLSDRVNFRLDYDHEIYENMDRGEFSVSVGVHW